MRVVTNQPLVKRNARIAQIAMFAGFFILVGGMYISFTQPEQFQLSLLALLLGFLLSQVGIYFTNRWGRKPRPGQILDQALKGLDKRHTLYHHMKPASHLLVGPSGIWVLLPQHQRGRITFEKGRYRQRSASPLLLYLRVFAQEGLGRPDLEVASEVQSVQNFIREVLSEDEKVPDVQAALIFTNPQAEIEIDPDEETPAAAVPPGKLKNLVRKSAKENSVPPRVVQQVQNAIESSIKGWVEE